MEKPEGKPIVGRPTKNLWPEIRARTKRRCMTSFTCILAIGSWLMRRSVDFGFQSEEVGPSEMVNISRYWRKILEENLWPEIRARIKRRCVSSVKWILAIVSWPIRRSSDFGFQSEEVVPSEMVNASRYWRKILEENLWPEIRARIKRRCVTSVTWIFAMGSWPMRRSGDFGFQRGNSLHSKAFLLPLLLSRSKDHGKEKTRPGRLSPPCCNLLFVVGFCRDFFRCLHAQRTFLAQNANP